MSEWASERTSERNKIAEHVAFQIQVPVLLLKYDIMVVSTFTLNPMPR